MGSIWALANVEELEFATTSRLLAKKAKTMSLSPTEQLDDDSSDEDEPAEDEDGTTSRLTSTLATCDHDALMNKFLDRLAEVFSREKSASHVAATVLIRADTSNPMTILAAKNEGLDDRDMKMLVRLQQWLRAVAITGRDLSILADSLWISEGGLVEYSRQRLWYHISRIQKDRKVAHLAATPNEVSVHITRVQSLCRDAKVDSSIQQLGDIIEVAYKLRCMWKSCPAEREVMKAVRDINMLGRLRAAYECFKAVAFTFDHVERLEMKPVVRRQDARSNVTIPYESMQRLCAEHHLPVTLLPDKSKYVAASSLHVHAEMQILVSLAQNADWHGRAHSYIGVSKKLCFLCDQVLRNYNSRVEEGARGPTLKARPCHGKVYSLWTLPLCEDLPSSSKRSLARSVKRAHARMRQKLPHKLQLQPAIAESSAGVTITRSTASVALLRDQHVKDHRPLASPNISNEGERPSALGRKIKTVRVGCLPANISDPDVVSIAFHDLSKTPGVKTFESGKEYVPDFREAWDAYQFDRRYRDI